MTKSLLIICQQPPWNISAKESLDIALSAGTFDIPTALLFLDDGVFQLIAQQNASVIEQKNISANLQALPLFGIERLLVAEHSLTTRGLASEQLSLPSELISQQQLTTLLQQYDVVITS